MYNALLVAKHIIKYCNEKDYTISNLKLQKLLYFVQAAFLVNMDRPCFPEEIEAWDFGPVVPVVYRKYKFYGSSSIPYISTGVIGRMNPIDRGVMTDMVDSCAKYSSSYLVEITHNQTPWIEAYVPYKSNVISKKSIKDFFTES